MVEADLHGYADTYERYTYPSYKSVADRDRSSTIVARAAKLSGLRTRKTQGEDQEEKETYVILFILFILFVLCTI